jgi:AcrR family transcriptional regulator
MQRARKAEDKALRKSALLAAARACFSGARYQDVKMSEVAEAAEVAKGTVFLYFPTKEALFLELAEDELGQWIAAVRAELERARGRLGPARVAEVVAESLAQRGTLTRLLPLIEGVLEENVPVERIVEFKTRLLGWMEPLAMTLERRLGLAEETGMRLLLRIYALVIGTQQLAEHSRTLPVIGEASSPAGRTGTRARPTLPVIGEASSPAGRTGTRARPTLPQAMKAPHLQLLSIELIPELKAALEALVAGHARRR